MNLEKLRKFQVVTVDLYGLFVDRPYYKGMFADKAPLNTKAMYLDMAENGAIKVKPLRSDVEAGYIKPNSEECIWVRPEHITYMGEPPKETVNEPKEDSKVEDIDAIVSVL